MMTRMATKRGPPPFLCSYNNAGLGGVCSFRECRQPRKHPYWYEYISIHPQSFLLPGSRSSIFYAEFDAYSFSIFLRRRPTRTTQGTLHLERRRQQSLVFHAPQIETALWHLDHPGESLMSSPRFERSHRRRTREVFRQLRRQRK